MKRLFLFSTVFILSSVLLLSCDFTASSDADPITISGEVINQRTESAIENAIVQITAPEELRQLTGTDESGEYLFENVQVDEVTDIVIEATKEGFSVETISLVAVPERNIEAPPIGLDDGNQDEQPDDSDSVGGEAAGPAAIILKSLSSNTINVAETGGTVNTAFTFAVQDSAGRTVGQGFEMGFEIIRGPGGGESITPEFGETNSSGTVTTNLFSGDSSGTVRVEAVIERPDVGLTIRSTPVLVSISSGFPHEENFNVGPRVYNFDAYNLIAENHTNPITASVGDLKGNPVKEGTAVYFSASNGGLVNGSAATNANGYATVNLSANGSNPSGHPMGVGFIDIVAQTVDRDNNYIEETMTMLLTTPRASISVNPDFLDVSNAGSQTFDVVINDLNGYPMAANTQISVETGEGLVASGDITGIQLGDYFDPGPGTTEFSVTISDSDPDRVVDTDGSFTIIVETPSGHTTTRTINGRRAKQ
ncbi:MAG: Ig-like domain-containing protein [Balneolaceae bacterium]